LITFAEMAATGPPSGTHGRVLPRTSGGGMRLAIRPSEINLGSLIGRAEPHLNCVERARQAIGIGSSFAGHHRLLMILSLQRPSAQSIRRFLTAQEQLDFSYAAVGATATGPPAGFDVDYTRIKLGDGEGVFQAAKAALERWRQFDLGWVEAWPQETRIQTGEVVAIVARIMGLWSLNAAKIVYVVDDSKPKSRFGLAYGTLPDHAESGEERFLVEWDHADDGVWYDILAFSRPNHLLARLGYPFVRRTQKRFARESAAAMLRAVRSESDGRAGLH
jgi:uncharacterized protein (UPF0548 family)